MIFFVRLVYIENYLAAIAALYLLGRFCVLDLVEDDPLPGHQLPVHRYKLLLPLRELGLHQDPVPRYVLLSGHRLDKLCVAGEDDVLLLLGQRDHLGALPPRRRLLHHRRFFVVHNHVSLQLPILFKLFTTRVTNFGQFFGFFNGPDLVR